MKIIAHRKCTTSSSPCPIDASPCQSYIFGWIAYSRYDRPLPVLVPENQLSYETIEPVLTFSNLIAFELLHKYPLKITLDEIEELASQWPSLEGLVLNAAPLTLGEDGFALDLRALLPFARHCPRLWKLGLYMNATEAETPSTHSSIEPFCSLRVLSVGTSQAHDRGTVAAFLSRVCPPGCVLEVGNPWDDFGPFEDHFSDELDQRVLPWKAIAKLLPVLIGVRREETERSRTLREEVEDLRIRNRLLMEQGHIKPSESSQVVGGDW
jgi:hypothetical protein